MSLLYASSTATVPGAVKEEVAVAAAGTMLQGIGPAAEAREESRTERASEAGPSSMSRMLSSGVSKLVEARAKSGAGSGAKAGSEAEAFPSELYVVNLVGARGRAMAQAGAGAGAGTEAGGRAEAGAFPSEPNVVNPVGARAKARAWAGAEAGAEARTEAGVFLSVAAEEDCFDEVEAAVAEEDWTTFFVKLVAAICGRLERKVEDEEDEEEKEEEMEEEEESAALMSHRLVSKAPEKFWEKSSICMLPICCIRNKSSFFFSKGFTPGTASLLCIKARKSTSVIVG